jgi:hypothetical protein
LVSGPSYLDAVIGGDAAGANDVGFVAEVAALAVGMVVRHRGAHSGSRHLDGHCIASR